MPLKMNRVTLKMGESGVIRGVDVWGDFAVLVKGDAGEWRFLDMKNIFFYRIHLLVIGIL